MNLKLESVDANYNIDTDRVEICENYVPTEEVTYVVLFTDRDDVTWAKRKVSMTGKEFERQKRLWKIDGVTVRIGGEKA